MKRLVCLLAVVLLFVASAQADVTIGNFSGGVAETGWGHFSGGVQPLDSDVYAVSDLDTSGDGGALETDLSDFSDSIGYSFTIAGTAADWYANDYLVFDMIYRGTATDDLQGGYSQVYQVLFQSDYNGYELVSYTTNADGIPLNQFGGGGTAVGWNPGTSNTQTVLGVAVDYRPFRDYLVTNGHTSPSTLQFWMSTNDDNRIYKAIDNVRLVSVVPEPASLVLLGLGVVMVLVRRRR